MGRGRAKAKQTKVARRLKYSGPDTDLQRLEAELTGRDDAEESAGPSDDGPHVDYESAEEPG
ncbi:MAG: DUF3073 domain-containing protein [Candidatus Nanopelagicales bacterium]|nr:DUF3073 domain-containing protein [Candidatus Nanopelagicales bacterium]